MPTPVTSTAIPGYPRYAGKVRDLYDLGDRLVLIATDRISAFDWVLPTPIPGKGILLTQMTRFWLDWLGVAHHLISDAITDLPPAFQAEAESLVGRTMLVHKTQVIPIECVVRGYLAGSAWKAYQRTGSICGIPLPAGLRQAEQLPEPIFTPATKASAGHDENISFEAMAERVGASLAEELRARSLAIYQRAAAYSASRGILIADTKLEWGHLPDGTILLIDEVFTPDSARFWPRDAYHVGQSPPSYDKQFVRDWLESSGWDQQSPPPQLPDAVVWQTVSKYQEALDRLVDRG